jgi:hypothetical protein
MQHFSAKIQKIGINPYMLLPATVLKALFAQAGADKGAIAVKGTLNGHPFIQHLVKYSGKWRLYLNTPMRVAAGIDVGDHCEVSIEFDPAPRVTGMHEALKKALAKNKKATAVFEKLPASYQKEIMRYINNLKTSASVERNVEKAIAHLLGKERFVGREPWGIKNLNLGVKK